MPITKEVIVLYTDDGMGNSIGEIVGEVVRCKDCKYFNPHIMECDGIGNWFGLEDVWSANDYCSKGERREDG